MVSCLSKKPSKKPVVITGCPKSGTKYIATVLQKMGLDFNHEQWAKDGVADWRLAPGKKAEPWDGNTHLSNFNNTVILHQVREPLNTISSCQRIGEPAWTYICRFIPVNPDDDLINKCMHLYYNWNLMAEKIAVWRYKVETLEDNFIRFCRVINYPEIIEKKDVLRTVPKNINTAKPYRKLTWSDLKNTNPFLCNKIKEMSIRYGYL